MIVERRLRAHLTLTAGLGVAAAVAGLLRILPPERFVLYRCPIHAWTGLLCPGCGGTRALAALLDGRLRDAWLWNPLVITLLPLALVYLAIAYRRALRGESSVWPQVPPAAALGLAAVTITFGIARNLL